MSQGTAHTTRKQLAAAEAAQAATSTSTSRADAAPAPTRASDDTTQMFGELSDPARMKMELIARASAGPEAALPAIVAIIAGADEAQQQAIVAAVMNNEPLREQWQNAWHALRS